ncbi:g7396 [Coccomyxa viridis]|uniref:G7396 protein n=1 Tax=Coccomyxa viridis TaxID=1274662 RepID=A0ABP1G0A7_9CHLO
MHTQTSSVVPRTSSEDMEQRKLYEETMTAMESQLKAIEDAVAKLGEDPCSSSSTSPTQEPSVGGFCGSCSPTKELTYHDNGQPSDTEESDTDLDHFVWKVRELDSP